MAGADACAKACLAMSPRPIELIVHSTLVYLRAIPLSLRTADANGAAPSGWSPYEGTPTVHAVNYRLIPFIRDRLQEAGVRRYVRKYVQERHSSRLAIDWVQAGLVPPHSLGGARWSAMVKHFNEGAWVYGAEHSAANSSTVATVAAGGGAIVHGVHVCPCGYEGKLDAWHWLTGCPCGPSEATRVAAAAALRATGDFLGIACM